MKVDLFDFDLPEELVATTPLAKRDASRMLVVGASGELQDSYVAKLKEHLETGDVLVLNNTKVMQARLFGKRGEAKIELLLHQQDQGTTWFAFAKPAKKLRVGDAITLDGGHEVTVLDKIDDGQVLLDTHMQFSELTNYLDQYGHVPLPPYIQKHREDEESDKERYQTVYSDVEKKRSVAAPTAGLHFTDALLCEIKAMGVEVVYVTLHVGAGTFLPVKSDDTDDHVMHSEQWEISEATSEAVNKAKSGGRRIIAVGTTSLRTLEGGTAEGQLQAGSGSTDIFIIPGYEFKMIDVLFTNFHLPKSTLFMLVSAFSGLEAMKQAYEHAKDEQYRFYSYGDSCLLHRKRNDG